MTCWWPSTRSKTKQSTFRRLRLRPCRQNSKSLFRRKQSRKPSWISQTKRPVKLLRSTRRRQRRSTSLTCKCPSLRIRFLPRTTRLRTTSRHCLSQRRKSMPRKETSVASSKTLGTRMPSLTGLWKKSKSTNWPCGSPKLTRLARMTPWGETWTDSQKRIERWSGRGTNYFKPSRSRWNWLMSLRGRRCTLSQLSCSRSQRTNLCARLSSATNFEGPEECMFSDGFGLETTTAIWYKQVTLKEPPITTFNMS